MVYELNEATDLPTPPDLGTLVRVDVVYGNESWSILCARCGLIEVRSRIDRWLTYPTKCLHVSGHVIEPHDPDPKILQCVQHLIPIQYVTYIGLGKKIVTFHPLEGGGLLVHRPELPPAINAMTEEQIRIALGELLDTDGPGE